MRIEPELIPLYASIVVGLGIIANRARKAVHVFDVLLGLVKDVDHRTARELEHNHGGSMKDDMTGLAVSMGDLQRRQDESEARAQADRTAVNAALTLAAKHHPEDAALYLALRRSL